MTPRVNQVNRLARVHPSLQEQIPGDDSPDLLAFRERYAGVIQHDLPGSREPNAYYQMPTDPVALATIEPVVNALK